MVRHQGIRWTYAEFGRRVDELARALMALGVERGERVGIWSTNRAEWALTQFATSKLGAMLVNVNPSYQASELEYALNQSGCRYLILTDVFKTTDYNQILESIAPEIRDRRSRGAESGATAATQSGDHARGSARAGMLTWSRRCSARAGEASSGDALAQRQACARASTIRSTSSTPAAPRGSRRARR